MQDFIFTYSTRIVERDFFFPDDSTFERLKIGEVVRSDGKVVWASAGYHKPRSALLQANKACAGFTHYLAQNGRCWRDDQDKEKAAKVAYASQQSAVVKRLMNAASDGARAAMAGKRATVPGKFKDQAAIWKAAHAAGKVANLPNLKEGQ